MTEREMMRYALTALRLVILVLGFMLGMAYTAWVFDHTFGTYFCLFIVCITGWVWYIIEKDIKDITDA